MEYREKISAFLKQLSFEEFNEMQRSAFDTLESDNDTLLLAPTGSGKTLAYAIPLLAKSSADNNELSTLVIAPTRELVLQIQEVILQTKSGISSVVCYGGHSITTEKNRLEAYPQIVIGTPGRLLDHISKGTLDLSNISYLAIDEYDKCLEMGFEDQILSIYQNVQSRPQKVLVSATKLNKLPSFVSELEEVNFLKTAGPDIELFKVTAQADEKMEAILDLLTSFQGESTIVFCNHRDTVDRLEDYLYEEGISTAKFHGGLQQDQRERSLIKFHNKSTSILLATDLAARGIDVSNIKNVVHYQLPLEEAQFIHRNGRTARQNTSGRAFLILKETDYLPAFVSDATPEFKIESQNLKPQKPLWKTLYIGAGKKDKVNKIDVVGFLIKQGGLGKDEVGKIDVKDKFIYVAIPSNKINSLVKTLNGKRIKKKKPKIAVAF